MCSQRPRTSSELPRKASRIDLSVKRTSCWTKSQLTYFQAAIGIPTTVSSSRRRAKVTISWAATTRQNRASIPRIEARTPACRPRASSRTKTITIAATSV